MGAAGSGLAGIVREELLRPAPEPARRLSQEARRRYGDAVLATLFYGSCLRNTTAEGVLDFYVIVDDYRRAYASRALAAANALLPPNVFYLELPTAEGVLRAKLAVISARDFARGTGPRCLRPGFWARFCQPAIAVHTRDERALETLVAAVAQAVRTAVTRGLGLLETRDGEAHFEAEALWLALFRETYASELRAESEATVSSLYAAAPERYAGALGCALDELADAGRARVSREADGSFRLAAAPGLLGRPRRARRLAAKAAGVAQLLKSAFTFGDWVPYALWKLERHTGTRLELSERQRRHPFLFAWPVFFRVLARRELR
jgi:hypothetical protein